MNYSNSDTYKDVGSLVFFFRRRLLRIWNPRPSTPINVGERGIHIRPGGRLRVGRMQTSERMVQEGKQQK